MKKFLLQGVFILCACQVRSQDSVPAILRDTLPVPDLPVVSLEDDDFKNEGGQRIASLLSASRDIYLSSVSFSFSAFRFRPRGYDNTYSLTYLNGVPLQNLVNGSTPFYVYSGLNEVMRSRQVSLGEAPSDYSFGDIGTTNFIDARAVKQKKETSFGYSFGNRSYTHRLYYAYNTGVMKHGWAITAEGSIRYSDENYIPGSFYKSGSYFLSVDKKFNLHHSLSFVVLGSPTTTARRGASTKEVFGLAGSSFYNPYWGYQNGKKRNAYTTNTQVPYFILTHEFNINNNTTLTSAAAYSFGLNEVNGLDWYNAPDPRPDYYKNLPSYQTDPLQQEELRKQIINNKRLLQIDWQRIYDVNRNAVETYNNANGILGESITGKRSRYLIGADINQSNHFSFNSILNARINKHFLFTGGISYQSETNHNYKQAQDILGGDYYVDLNQFAENTPGLNASASQPDLNQPNHIIKAGDKYDYNYSANIQKAEGWSQLIITLNKIDAFAAGKISASEFHRVGEMRNGLFPDHSYGISPTYRFTNHAVKAGITYKFNGRNYFFVNGSYSTQPPFFENAYLSPRTCDNVLESLPNQTIISGEAGYALNTPAIRLKLSAFYTTSQHELNVLSFYHDDYHSLVNYALSNIDKIYSGVELATEIKILPVVLLKLVAAKGAYYYGSRFNANVTLDNDPSVNDKEVIYSKNFSIPSTPQEAYSAGLTYRSPKYWMVSLTGNYVCNEWLDFNPVRRTYPAIEDVDAKSDLWNEIISQTKLQSQFTADVFAGYSWKLPKQFRQHHKDVFLQLNVGISNLLNNKNIVAAGYEQLRFDFTNKDINKFPPKYHFSNALNYYLSASFKF